MKNNISFGFLNFQTIKGKIYYIYGMMVGIETKIIVAFQHDRPLNNEIIKDVCMAIYNMYLSDTLNPFHKVNEGPSKNLQSKLESYVANV